MKYVIHDPLPVRIRQWFAEYVTCPIFGHRPVRKFGGTILCGRHD